MKSRNKTTLFNILSTVLLSGISIFTSPLFSRLLGTDGYGIVSIYTTWVSIVAIIFTLQTQQTLVHARTHFSENQQNRYQSSVLGLSCIIFSACTLFIILFIKPISSLMKLDSSIIVFIMVHAFGTYCVSFINNKFTYEFKADRNFMISMGVTLSTILLSIILIYLLPSEISYYGRILGLSLVYGCIGVGVCVYIFAKGKCLYNRHYWEFCVPLALPLVFQCLADLLLGHSDRLMLQRMIDHTAVGQYSLAYSFAGILFTLFSALNNSWCPFFYDGMKNNQIEQVRKFSNNFLELFTVLTIGFMLLAKEVYHIFASKEYWAGTGLVFLFALSNYLIFLSTFSINYELFHKKTNYLAGGTILSMSLNIILNFFLIRLLGMFGAAIATAISYGIQFIFHYIIASRVQKTAENPFQFRMYIPYITTILITFFVVYITSDLWWLRWSIGAVLGLIELYRVYKRKTIF